MSVKNIAIDGYAGCGKSSTAKAIAKRLNMVYVDTGAMYRAVTYFFIKKKVDIKSTDAIISTLKTLNLSFTLGETNDFILKINGKVYDNQLRTKAVNEYVSTVSALKEVRQFLLEKQRQLASNGNVVIEGRDIGTNVMPDAEVKMFVIAEMGARIERRYKELQEKGIEMTKFEIEENFLKRDELDTKREYNPLRKAKHAVVLDTTDLTFDAQVEKALEIILNAYKWR